MNAPFNRLSATTAAAASLLLAACGGVAASPPASSASATASPVSTLSASPTSSAPAGWVPYSSTTYHVAFYHPAGWSVVCDQPTGNWLLIDTAARYTDCPQGDGMLGIFIASVAAGAQPNGLGLISTNPSLYSNVTRSMVTIDGVSGTRITGDQTTGQGSGTSQIEYDLTTGGRSYSFLALVSVPGAVTATPSQFDQFMQTVSFTN